MKFVHIADMHFDTPFTLLSSRRELGEARRIDQRQVFKKIINYIKENKIPYLFIAGDLYEQESIRQSTIEYINNLFKEIPETKIYIAPGNHDPYLSNSYYNKYIWNENVKIFKAQIEKIEEPEFNLYGFGFDDFYCYKSEIENIKIEDKTKINILLTHASLDGGHDEERAYNTLSSSKLKEIGFDYVALGHIHKPKLTENIIYPGSTISMGFDELGKHGMIVGEINKNTEPKIEFIELDEKEFIEKELDISEINTIEELIQKISEINIEENKYYKIILIGNRNFEINTYKLYKKIEIKNIIKIKDKTKINYKLEEIANEVSLKGLFAKEMLNKINNIKTNKNEQTDIEFKINGEKQENIKENINQEIIEKAIEIGMEVLS